MAFCLISVDPSKADSYCESSQNGRCPSKCKCTSVYEAQCSGIEEKDLKKLPYCLTNLTINGECDKDTTATGCLKTIRDKDVFTEYTKLKELKITNTHLSTFPNDIFRYNTNLERLNLQNNKLAFHRNSAFFSNLHNLKHLDLQTNAISFVDDSMFKGLTSLTDLNLSRNYLRYFHSGILTSLPKLANLSLVFNHIGNIRDEFEDTTSNVKVIDLSYNYIQSIHPDSFKKMKSLHTLHLSHNNLECSCNMYKLFLNLNANNVETNGWCKNRQLAVSTVSFYTIPRTMDCMQTNVA